MLMFLLSKSPPLENTGNGSGGVTDSHTVDDIPPASATDVTRIVDPENKYQLVVYVYPLIVPVTSACTLPTHANVITSAVSTTEMITTSAITDPRRFLFRPQRTMHNTCPA